MACVMLGIYFRVAAVFRTAEHSSMGQVILYRLIMHIMQHVCPEEYFSIKAAIETEMLSRGLINLDEERKSET